MHDFLLSLGFRMFKSCNCGGGKKNFKKATMPGIEITLFKRSDSYEIKRSNKVINRGMSHHLETEYNKIFV